MSVGPDARFRIHLAEAETGIVLDLAGARIIEPGAEAYIDCSTWKEALEKKDALLRAYPFAEAWIHDISGQQSASRFVDEAGLAKYLAASARWNQWRYANPIRRLFMRKPPNPRSSR
ncbi:MAG: hypothetical protein QM820_06400 [Minicystis sp.]